ncbi:MAG: 2-oxoacid:acceptor oxidoreductase family protein, partial [Flavisolibacter sp.]
TSDAYGTKVMIDPQICVSDSYCTKIKACPSFELVKVHDYHPTKYKTNKTVAASFDKLSSPSVVKSLADIASGSDFRTIVIGVGGSGVTTISRIIAEASTSMGGREDLQFKFMDQKGPAQRNGSVISHLSIFSSKKVHGPVLPVGSADLVVSPDLLEGARAIEYLGPQGILIVDEEFQVPLSILLDRGIDTTVTTPESLQQELKTKLGDRVIMAPLKQMSFERFQRPVYASAMILGIAYQAGRLPFSVDDLKAAFASAVPKAEIASNWEAFNMGRDWYSNKNAIKEVKTKVDNIDLWKQSAGMAAYPWQSSQKFVNMWTSYTKMLSERLPEIPLESIRQYVHDLIVFDQGKFLPEFFENAIALKKTYSGDSLVIALRALAKTYWIKDEVFVSHQMISPLKTEQDKHRYKDLGTSFEVVHINRPAFLIAGRKIEFDFSPKPWMLSIMKNMRILRKMMPEWHKNEKEISLTIRNEILKGNLSRSRLMELDTIKGYREVRYKFASKFLGKKYV